MLILRTKIGFEFFDWLGDKVTIFLSFNKEGATFLFRGLEQFAFSVSFANDTVSCFNTKHMG